MTDRELSPQQRAQQGEVPSRGGRGGRPTNRSDTTFPRDR
jgi:hypothetical protein